MKSLSQEETTTKASVSTFLIVFIEYFLHLHKLRRNVTDCGGVLCLHFKCSGAITCEYREIQILQCGILIFLFPSEAHSNCIQIQKHQTTAESLCTIHYTLRPIAFIAFLSLMLGFLMFILLKFLYCLPAEKTTLQ